MTMKDAISKVKAAIAPKDIASHLSHYLVKGKMIHGSDNRITAAAPFPYDGEFLVPSREFEAVANKFGPGTRITVEENSVIFTDGKMRATVRTLPTSAVDYVMPQGTWKDLPGDFLAALSKVRAFISENAVHYWALSVCLEKDAIYATNNVVIACAECKGLEGEGRLLPAWAVDYILSRSETLETIISEPTSMTFLWGDGSWMLSRLVDSKFPEAAETLIGNMAQPSFRLEPLWKEALSTAIEMSETLVEIHGDKMVGHTEHGVIEVKINSPAPVDGGISKWNTKFLAPVIQVAEFFQPDAWPKPAPFTGPGIRGLIIGRY